METIALEHGPLRAGLAPAAGGCLTRFQSVTAAGTVDWLRPAGADAAGPLDAACFPMVPWFSWMADDRLVHDGREIPLPVGGHGFRHALHGFGWLAAWNVEAVDGRSARLVHRPPPGVWPWPYVATQTVALDDAGLSIRLDLVNEAAEPMPAGLGLHPFFERRDGLAVRAGVAAMHRMSDRGLPCAAEPDAAAVAALTVGAELPVGLNNIFEGWDGTAVLSWADGDLRLEADTPYDFLCIFAPSDRPIACIEPVTHTTDAMNTRQVPWGRTGYRLLDPGEGLSASARFRPSGSGQRGSQASNR